MSSITLHFEINKKNGRVTIYHKPGDTRLRFRSRKYTTIRDLGLAFLKIAKKAEKIKN